MSEHDPLPFGDEGSGAPEVLRDAITLAREQTPSAKQIAGLAARLPLGAPPPAGGGGGGGGGAPVAAPPSMLSGALVGAALGVMVSGAGLYWDGRREPPAVVMAAREVAAVTAPAVSEAPIAAPSNAPAAVAIRSVASAAPRPVAATASAKASASATAAEPEASAAPASAGGAVAAPVSNLESELRLLQLAHDALRSSPAQALALTDQLVARFPGGALAQEREVVAIDALLRLGRAGEARARGQRFLAAFPGSAHRRRIEALIGP